MPLLGFFYLLQISKCPPIIFVYYKFLNFIDNIAVLGKGYRLQSDVVFFFQHLIPVEDAVVQRFSGQFRCFQFGIGVGVVVGGLGAVDDGECGTTEVLGFQTVIGFGFRNVFGRGEICVL